MYGDNNDLTGRGFLTYFVFVKLSPCGDTNN